MKHTAQFTLSGNRCLITVETPRQYQTKGKPELSVTGAYDGSAGQCVNRILAASGGNEQIERLCYIWNKYHLKPVPASIVSELETILKAINGKYIGTSPDVSDAPELGGDVMDSRDVIRAYEIYANAVASMGVDTKMVDHGENWPQHIEEGSDESDVLEMFIKLRELDEAGSGACADWLYGATLIRDSYFEQYAEDYASDIGAINRESAWPACHIDWEAAANALKIDYSTVEWDGETYWVR